ncbi:MAG: SUMF1/EgtB/PvdO family nonheme iron enzyme [Anaerolineaceae bacterium]|nr:SUMF1/EgtB/PvdO family nonheme iron enzyme [Anaerolineaceae bacterium]
MQDYIGKQIDRYRVTERLGMGGMAVVYKAYDTRLERVVAIKLIRTESIPQDQHERLMKRFEREAKSQARFDHKHIVHVYDYGEVDGAPYLVMAYIPGGTLKARTGKPIAYPQVIHWLIPVADALSYAHKRGVIHRDIKPSNILFDDEDQPILTDFGIAKLLETDDATLTGTGLGVGTPEYMAPEQWQGQASPATDQYALGVVLYELLTGHKPYTADTPAAVAIQQAIEPLRSPRSLVPAIPEPVEKLLYKALARVPRDRFEDMTAFRTALEKQLTWRASEPAKPREAIKSPASAPAKPPLSDIGSEAETVDALEPTPAELQKPHEPRLVGASRVTERQKRFVFASWERWSIGASLLVIVLLFGISLLRQYSEQVPADSAEPIPVVVGMIYTSTPSLKATAIEVPTHTPTAEPTLGFGSSLVNPVDGSRLVYVPEGEFLMGSEDSLADNDEQPEHFVWLSSFWIYQTEVTNAMYRQCVEDNGCDQPTITTKYQDPNFTDHPVVYVDWNDADDYCQWAGGRLPTEAEWEKAARGTDGRLYPWGNQAPTCSMANYDFDCVKGTSPAGSYLTGASPYGVLDMAGNVGEWVSDWYDADYYSISAYDNPTGPDSGDYHVLRGGSWFTNEAFLRVSARSWFHRGFPSSTRGFRCVHSLEP